MPHRAAWGGASASRLKESTSQSLEAPMRGDLWQQPQDPCKVTTAALPETHNGFGQGLARPPHGQVGPQ